MPHSSQAEYESSSDEYDTDEGIQRARGRTESRHGLGSSTMPLLKSSGTPSSKRIGKHRMSSSQSSSSRRSSPVRGRVAFTRSRSPAVRLAFMENANISMQHRTSSPSLFSRTKHLPSRIRDVFPSTVGYTFRLPFSKAVYTMSMDVRQAIENLLLLSSVGFVAVKLRTCSTASFDEDMWISIELSLLTIASFTKMAALPSEAPSATSISSTSTAAHGRNVSSRDPRRGVPLLTITTLKNDETGFVWMTVPKNYRVPSSSESPDDGILTGLLAGPLITGALLYLTIQAVRTGKSLLPPTWLIEAPAILSNSIIPYTAVEALLLSRRTLVNQATFCSTILIVHICSSWVTEARHRREKVVPNGELSHVPRKEGRRTYLYALFVVSVTLWVLCVKIAMQELHLGVWQSLSDMNYLEVIATSMMYQGSLFFAIRLAHRGFTLGELALVCFGATVLFMEMTNLTLARIWPISIPYIKTYRLPTPLLIYQIALIPGSLLTGFLLSPLLYLSRHIARQPVRRLRFPEQRHLYRRLLAAGFYLGTVVIVAGLIGLWTRWCLGNRDPWVWAVFWLLEGRRKWSRAALLTYWALLLARSRRYRHRSGVGVAADSTVASMDSTARSNGYSSGGGGGPCNQTDGGTPTPPAAIPPQAPATTTTTMSSFFPDVNNPYYRLNFPELNLRNLPNLPNGTQVATDLLDAADKHVPTLSVNARRKYFHALAVVMFLPGVVVDPAFTHMSFSAAFALFTFAEYVRYFALYPFGAAVHVFMHEFLDTKDSGTAILSHFYLLTGCANSVWFEGPSLLLQFTGILALGVGDALASIAGKRIGRHRWCTSSSKTVEGSIAFTVSVVFCAWLLRVCGFTEEFSIIRYGVVAGLSSVLEAFSLQNDNLTLPLYMWSMLAVVDSQDPPLTVNDLSLSLAPNAIPHISIPRLAFPSRSPPKGKIRRPSTASSAEERSARLPSSSSNSSEHLSPMSTPGLGMWNTNGNLPSEGDAVNPLPMEKLSLEEMNRKAHAAVAGLRAEASRLSVEVLPSPFDPSPTDELTQAMASRNCIDDQADYDWATFINAYALGRWDPLRTPHPPRSHLQPPLPVRSVLPMTPEYVSKESYIESSPEGLTEDLAYKDYAYYAPIPDGDPPFTGSFDPVIQSAPPQFHTPSALAAGASAPSLAPQSPHASNVLPDSRLSRLTERRMHNPLNVGPFAHRLRNSVADLRASSTSSASSTVPGSESMRPLNQSTEMTTSAAAIRWAAAHVSVAPLALPSPEHELTDPMRGVTATIPGSHPQDMFLAAGPEGIPLSPNGNRKSRLSSFWQGTQDVEYKLPAIQASPPEIAGANNDMQSFNGESEQKSARSSSPTGSSASIPFIGVALAPATAPVRFSSDQEDDDYFGSIDMTMSDSIVSLPQPLPSHPSSSASNALLRQSASGPPFHTDPVTVPALPRRICLTRQTSAPLPTLPTGLFERRLKSARPMTEKPVPSLASRAVKEEQMFQELGYLAPPNPPDELERRRALYKFNIWNTGSDSNFDRICHLVKLVFSTRIVMISLVDGTEVFLKSASGLSTQNLPRTASFDAHALLQRDDEPTVVLDTHEDWRFAKNPLVTGVPHVRFYAACPLRTQDGFNIGTLTIMDDMPRREFSPRQRHTLKEFAQITMRELELWRDKIQLRVRDRIQTSMEEFTRECLEVDRDPSAAPARPSSQTNPSTPHTAHTSKNTTPEPQTLLPTSMEQIYERAAKLVKRTLDIEGAIVIDVSHVDIVETMTAESSTTITIHNADKIQGTSTTTRILTSDEHGRLQEFFSKFPEGKISEGLVPAALRPFLPCRIQYALSVPIYNVDKRPFAVLCAYSTGERTTPFLEGHELSYLRAIGVIILSAVLKRRMILADKAKSLFISNISHELRTPLHGILASAELLSETNLDHSQASFLQTVQACGTSLVETVNHVLDFTKLSGNVKAGGVENAIHRSKVDLMQLVEEATEGCWIGHRARMFTSEIGSVYSPPKPPDHPRQVSNAPAVIGPSLPKMVETVVDIGHNPSGWVFRCEKGGIRRILMNLFGNSLKFTTDGYVHVMLRQVPNTPDQSLKTVKIELTVADTGKCTPALQYHTVTSGMEADYFNFEGNQSELPEGTGLGLAIVNSIVRSSSVDGKVDVWSAEGAGTEIKITFTAEALEDDEMSNNDAELVNLYNSLKRPSISLVGFDYPHRGVQLLKQTLVDSLTTRWGFTFAESQTGETTEGEDTGQGGDIVIVNEDYGIVAQAIQEKETTRPYIILSSSRGDPRLMKVVGDYERKGGFCRVAYKPVGPHRLFSVLKLCIHALNIGDATSRKRSSSGSSSSSVSRFSHPAFSSFDSDGKVVTVVSHLPRRLSEETSGHSTAQVRPPLGPRAITVHPLTSWAHMDSMQEQEEPAEVGDCTDTPVFSQSPSSPTIAVGTGGTLLKSVVGSAAEKGPLRVLIVEDNEILRSLLIKWLKNKGYDYRAAVDGQDGVQVFETGGHFDVVLVDLSMPVLDGIGATIRMRDIESSRQRAAHIESGPTLADDSRSRILALTGMSSLDDKKRAFDAGVDGYLVKPVAFKTLDSMFHKLGFS
ncbi:Fph type histidine kinase [Cristinia sonorae]|uniref:dolichol kinase n=1 Tax=Cristinia sonorae TaxID=1940300 RepID=A0A8K0XQQ7_9AGAR|nr:Fph type histidine kinase [Cristinia sonorae]